MDGTGLGQTGLPAEHPFENVQLGHYWSGTTRESENSDSFLSVPVRDACSLGSQTPGVLTSLEFGL